MGEQYRKYQAGQPLRLPAAQANAWTDAALAEQRRKHDQSSDFAANPPNPSVVLVRNSTGEDRDQFEVLGIGAPLIGPDDNLREFHRIAFEGETPTAAHTGKFVVLLEPLADGRLGRAVLSGATSVQINVQEGDEDFEFADVREDDCSTLEAAEEGSAQILWREDGTGEVWAYVRLSNTPADVFDSSGSDSDSDSEGSDDSSNVSDSENTSERESSIDGSDGSSGDGSDDSSGDGSGDSSGDTSGDSSGDDSDDSSGEGSDDSSAEESSEDSSGSESSGEGSDETSGDSSGGTSEDSSGSDSSGESSGDESSGESSGDSSGSDTSGEDSGDGTAGTDSDCITIPGVDLDALPVVTSADYVVVIDGNGCLAKMALSACPVDSSGASSA